MTFFYPNRIIQSGGENSNYVEFSNLDNIRCFDDSYAITGEIEAKSGKRRYPPIIRATDFKCRIPLDSKVNEIRVEVAQEFIGDISIKETIIDLLNIKKIENREVDLENKIHKVTFKVNSDANEINSPYFGVNIKYTGNTSENAGHLKLRFVRIFISYENGSKIIAKLKRISHNSKIGYRNITTGKSDFVFKLYYVLKTISRTRLEFMEINGGPKSLDDELKEFMLKRVPNYEKKFSQEFEEMLKIRGSYSGWRLKLYRLDYMLCNVFLGSTPEDYLSMFLDKKGWIRRNHEMSTRRLYFLVSKFNPDREKRKIVNNKICTCRHWDYAIHRKWCDPQETSLEQFIDEFKGFDKLLLKPVVNRGGIGIQVFDTTKTSLNEIFQWSLSQPSPYMIEEYHHQTGWLHEANPSSLNTIRVITAKVNGKTVVLPCFLRCGLNNSVVDNLKYGGLLFTIEQENGFINKGANNELMDIVNHPNTGVKIAGETVPRWEEIIQFCKKAHEHAPDSLNLIGWDVCLDEDDLSLIEANSVPGFPPMFDAKYNLWKHMLEYMRQLEKYD